MFNAKIGILEYNRRAAAAGTNTRTRAVLYGLNDEALGVLRDWLGESLYSVETCGSGRYRLTVHRDAIFPVAGDQEPPFDVKTLVGNYFLSFQG